MTKYLSNIAPEMLENVLSSGIEYNDIEYVTAALEQGANPNANPIVFDVTNKDILNVLIDYGLDVNTPGLLESYINDDKMDLVKVLIRNGVNLCVLNKEILCYLISFFKYDDLTTAFIMYSLNPKGINKLIFFGNNRFSIEIATKFKDKLDFNFVYDGETPLTHLIKGSIDNQTIKAIEFLLDNGSNPNFLYENKTNILAHTSDTYVLELLVKYDIDVNNVDIYGNTPLFYSTSPSFTHYLIKDYGANIHHRNNNGEDFLCMVNDIFEYDLQHCLDNGLSFNPFWCTFLRSKRFLNAVNSTVYSDKTVNISNIIAKYTDIEHTNVSIDIDNKCEYSCIEEIVEAKGKFFVKYYLSRYPSILENTFKSGSERRYFYNIINSLGLPSCIIKRAINLSYHTDDLMILFYLSHNVFDSIGYLDKALSLGLSGDELYYLEKEDAKKLFKTQSSVLKYIDFVGASFELLTYFDVEPTDCPICLCSLDEGIVAYSNCCKRASFLHVDCFIPSMETCLICRKDCSYYTDEGACSRRL